MINSYYVSVLLACFLTSNAVKIVPFPIAGDVWHFTPETLSINRALPPHAILESALHEDEIARVARELQERENKALAHAQAMRQFNNRLYASRLAYNRYNRPPPVGLAYNRSPAEAFLGQAYKNQMKWLGMFAIFIFIIGFFDYSAIELHKYLTIAYLAYFYMQWQLGAILAVSVLYSKLLLPSFYLIPVCLVTAIAISLLQLKTINSLKCLRDLGWTLLALLLLSSLHLPSNTIISICVPILIVIGVPVMTMFVNVPVGLVVRGSIEGFITSIGLLGALNELGLGPRALTQPFDPLYLFTTAYSANVQTPEGLVGQLFSWILLACMATGSASLQMFREKQRGIDVATELPAADDEL